MKMDNSFWITNVSDRNVSLADLNLTVQAFTSINLLDTKHHSYTREQLESSAKNGSLFKKRHLLKVRKSAPVQQNADMLIDRDAIVPTRQRSVLDIKEKNYEELNITDEQFMEEMSEQDPQTIPPKR